MKKLSPSTIVIVTFARIGLVMRVLLKHISKQFVLPYLIYLLFLHSL